MASLSESASRTAHWGVWAGALIDLRRVLRTVEDQYASRLPGYVVAESASARRSVEHYISEVATWRDLVARDANDGRARSLLASREEALLDAEANLAAAENAARGNWRIGLRAQYTPDDTRSVAGSADEISTYLEDKRFRRLEFEFPSGYVRDYSVRLTASEDGLKLAISSSDSGWVAAAFIQVSDEIRKSVPWWRPLRNTWFLLSFFGIGLFIAWVLLASSLYNQVRSDPAAASVYGFLTAFIVLPAILLFAWVARRAIPAFEVVDTRPRARGAVLLGLFGSTILAIVVGVFVNAVS